MWTGLPVEESIRMTEDRHKWRKYVHGVASPRIEDGERTEQNGFERRLEINRHLFNLPHFGIW